MSSFARDTVSKIGEESWYCRAKSRSTAFRLSDTIDAPLNPLRKRRHEETVLRSPFVCVEHNRPQNDVNDHTVGEPRDNLFVDSSKLRQRRSPINYSMVTTRSWAKQKPLDIIGRLSGVPCQPNQGDFFHVSFDPPLLSQIDTRDVFAPSVNDASVGCILILSTNRPFNQESVDEITTIDFLAGLIKSKLVGEDRALDRVSESIKHGIYDLICMKSDSMEEIHAACTTFTEASICGRNLLGADELGWLTSKSVPIRQLAFLRRLMHHVYVKVKFESCEIVKRLPFCFIEVLFRLDSPGHQAIVIDAMLLRTCQLQEQANHSPKQKHLQLNLLSTLNRSMKTLDFVDRGVLLGSVKHLLVHAPSMSRCVQIGLRDGLTMEDISGEDVSINCASQTSCNENETIWQHYLHIESEWSRSHFEARSSLPNMRAVKIAIRTERQRLNAEYESKQKSLEKRSDDSVRISSRKAVLHARNHNGDLILTGVDISADAFLKTSKFMNRVNATLLRPFHENHSRPKLQQLTLSEDKFKRIKALFFDLDGSLRSSMKKDIDTSFKHGYINFNNKRCLDERKDQRWQVPLKSHKKSPARIVRTRKSVERILHGIIDPRFEKLHDVGMLIGGTEDQSLHHDVARQIVTWTPEVAEGGSTDLQVAGWEVDRKEYNAAMASPHAPSSLVIGMGENREVLLGVQKDQIQRLSELRRCKIIHGTGETYDIVRENDKLVVIRVPTGCMFTGDFPHAGVRNIVPRSHEDILLRKLNQRILTALQELPDDRLAQMRAVIDVLCSFPGLDKLCRLHCSTEVLHGNLQIPANTIGFTACEPNTPDSRCFEEDPLFDSDRDTDDPPSKPTPALMAKSSPNINRLANRPHVTINALVEEQVKPSLSQNKDDGTFSSFSDDDMKQDQSYDGSEVEDCIPLLRQTEEKFRNSRKLHSVKVTPQSSPPHDLDNIPS